MNQLISLPTLQPFPPMVMSKLIPPPEPARQVVRYTLLEKLCGIGPHKLTLVHAPAGFGKTTLLLQYLSHCRMQGRRALWLTLDAADNDLDRFIRHLQAGWNGCDPQSTPAAGLIEQLALYDQPFSILLDEFEVIQAPAVLDLLQQLLEYLPPNGEVVIGSRQQPTLRLATLRARGQLLEIGQDELCLSLDETTQLLKARFDRELQSQDIALLHKRTEGWVAAIQLVTLSLPKYTEPAEMLRRYSGSHFELATYLTEDILLRLPQEQQDFLLSTSVYDQFNDSACDWLTGRDDSREILNQLLRDNLFLVPLDGHGENYRYHSLFVSYLRTQLIKQPGQRHANLQRRAAEWFQQQNRPIRAIDHLLLAGDHQSVIDVLDAHADQLLAAGRVRRLLRWFDQLPHELLTQHPRLRLTFAWALTLNRRYAEAVSHIEDVKRSIPEEALHARTLECMLLAMSDRIDDCFRACDEHLPQLPDGNPLQLGILVTIQSHYMIAANRCEEARQLMSRVMGREKQIRNTFIRSISEYNEGWIDLLQGRLVQAQVRLQTSYRSSWRDGQKGVPGGKAMIGVPLAEVLYEMNQLAQARRLVGECLPYARQNGHVDALILSYVLLSRLATSEDDRETALRYLTELENIGLDLDLPRVRASARLEQARLHWMHGDMFLSERIVREVEALPLWAEIEGYVLPAQEIETPATMRWRLAITNGQADKVIDDLKQAIRQAQHDLRMRRCLKLKLLLAMAYHAQDKQQNALQMITEALQLASDEGFVRSFLDEGSTLHPLLRLWRARHQRMALPANISDSFVEQLLAQIGEPVAQPIAPTPSCHEAPPLDPLSKRELQVLHYIAEGLRNREIADKIFLSETTVKAHMRRIHSKLDAHSRTQAVAIARKHGWI